MSQFMRFFQNQQSDPQRVSIAPWHAISAALIAGAVVAATGFAATGLPWIVATGPGFLAALLAGAWLQVNRQDWMRKLRTQASARADSDARLAALGETLGVIELKPDGIIASANGEFCRLTGYEAVEVCGRHHSMLVPSSVSAGEAYREVWQSLNDGQVQVSDLPHCAKDGRELTMRAAFSPLRNDAGQVSMIVCHVVDITESAAERFDLQGRVAAISRSQAIVEFDLDGKVISANANFCTTMGYALDEIEGRHHSMFVTSEEASSAEYKAFWEKLARGEFVAGEFERVGQDERLVLLQASYNPVLDAQGRPYKIIKFATDLTRSDRMRENTRIRAALDNASTNVMVADADFNIVYMNKAQQGMMRTAQDDIQSAFGEFHADRLIGQNMDIFHKDPDHQREMMKHLTRTHRADLKIGNRDFRLKASPAWDVNGARIGTVVEWADRTAEVAIEREIESVVQAVSAGDFSASVTTEGKSGFNLVLAEQVNDLAQTVSEVLSAVAEVLVAMSKGDLSQRVKGSFSGVYGELQTSANTTAANLEETVRAIKLIANEVAVGAQEITMGASDLSARTEQQAANLEETAASMEQMSSIIKQTASNSDEANALAAGARSLAETGGEVVDEAVKAMRKIDKSSRRIADIISVVDEIAFQTNLLALNAAVEAARAGDAGRGFAVVAAEVRSLAQRSGQAAKDIKELIATSSEEVKGGVELVDRAGTTLEEIVQAARGVASIVMDISNATREQSIGVEEINLAVASMDEMTQQNSALVEENAAAAKAMSDQADQMRQQVGFFSFAEGGQPLHREQRRVTPTSSARGLQAALAQSVINEDDDWSEF